MIQHIWTIPCRVAITDQETNNVSLIEVLEEIVLTPLPAQQQDLRRVVPVFFDVVSLWCRQDPSKPELGYARSSLLSPQGETVIQHVVMVDLREHRRCRTFGKILSLPVQASGTYHFKIETREKEEEAWQEVARIPLYVSVEPPPDRSGQPLEAAGAVSQS